MPKRPPFELTRAGALGAVVDGLDLKEPLSDEVFAALRHALAANEVLFFRDQFLDGDQQLALARRFGDVSLYPIEKLFGADEPGHQVIVDDEENPPGVDLWHTDVSWLERPPGIALLTALEIPAWGGDTMWASTTMAYEALSPTMRGMLDGLECVHSCHEDFVEIAARKSGIPELADKIRAAYPALRHPLVRTHPETGKRSLFLTDRGVLHEIEGLPADESEAILDFLDAHVDQPRFHVRWKWSPGELAIWDERTTLHRGVSDHYPQRRVIRRCTVDGEAPFFDPSRTPDPSYVRAGEAA
jgi:taurine dioxygenase